MPWRKLESGGRAITLHLYGDDECALWLSGEEAAWMEAALQVMKLKNTFDHRHRNLLLRKIQAAIRGEDVWESTPGPKT